MTSPEGTTMMDLSVPIGRNRRPASLLEIDGGSTRGFSFSIRRTSNDRADGILTYHLEEKAVGPRGGVCLDADGWAALLMKLAEAWPYLRVEETYPNRVVPKAPSELATVLFPQASHDSVMERVARFRLRHDIASWFGSIPASEGLFLLREGNFFVAEANGRVLRLAYGDVLRTLLELGEAVCRIVEGLHSERCAQATRLWHARDNVPSDELESIASGVNLERVVQLQQILPRRTRAEIFAGMDEVRAAARGLAPIMTDENIGRVTEAIRSYPPIRSETLDTVAREAERKLAILAREPYSLGRFEGLGIARWFRESILRISEDTRFDVESYLASVGVVVQELEMQTEVEAVAFWGRSHGPGIILNPNGRRSRVYRTGSTGGTRFTLAHELGHLLLDTRGSLPVAEIMRRTGPSMVEERANAFAAEVLLPERAAAHIYRNGQNLDEVIDEITKGFGVTRTLAAWQLHKAHPEGSTVLPEADRRRLSQIVTSFNRSSAY